MVSVFAIGLLLSAIACSGTNTPAVPTPTQASITATASPNPITATVCSPACTASNNGSSYQFRVAGTLVIQENAGIGGNVDVISTEWCSPACVYSSTDIAARSGTARIQGHGILAVPMSFVYGLVSNPNASRSTSIPLAVQFTDDRGNKLAATVTWITN